MAWKDLDYQGRVSVLTSGVQAAATFGMFLVAIIGIWKVTPIITYQVQQMQPSQYIQFKVNQGAFEDLPDAQRQRVEIAVERYVNRVMVPVVPPLMVRPDMSLKELHSEISSTRHHREDALRHIKRLQEVITAAMEEPH